MTATGSRRAPSCPPYNGTPARRPCAFGPLSTAPSPASRQQERPSTSEHNLPILAKLYAIAARPAVRVPPEQHPAGATHGREVERRRCRLTSIWASPP